MLSVYACCGFCGLIAIFFALFIAKSLHTLVYCSSPLEHKALQEYEEIRQSDIPVLAPLTGKGHIPSKGREHP